MKHYIFIAAISSMAATQAAAQNHQHEAHVHGEAQLNLVIENHEMLVELQTPAANLLGFEHAPATKAEKQQLRTAESLLSDPATLISLTNNPCQLVDADIEMPFSTNEKDQHNDHDEHHHDNHNHNNHGHDKHHHDHGGEHQTDSHHDKHQDKHGSDHSGSDHSDVHAQYTLQCQAGKTISELSINLFDHFAGMKKLQLMWIKGNQQGSASLTATNYKIDLPE